MKEFWNERFSNSEFIYGKEPNVFFRQQIDHLTPGRLLLPAEGEGRNAVYAATLGWNVMAFDFSEQGKRKALELALEKGVTINYMMADYHSVVVPDNHFDALALIYAHAPDWQQVYAKLISSLRPGGVLIIEIFNKKQIHNLSGGPKVAEMLVDADELIPLLGNMSSVKVWEEETELKESQWHQGKADVTRCIAVK